MRIKNKVWIGSVFCILSACLWGVSGAVGQYLFNQAGISPEWLVSARCLLTGLLLLVFYQVKRGGVFSIWMDRQDRIGIIIFALGGMLFMQYGYFAAIAHSNAATATVLQYTAPILIVVYLAFREKKLPTKLECIAVFGCLVGTILLATHGNLKSLSLSPQALFWGALSSLALAFYTVYPARLLAKYASDWVVDAGSELCDALRTPLLGLRRQLEHLHLAGNGLHRHPRHNRPLSDVPQWRKIHRAYQEQPLRLRRAVGIYRCFRCVAQGTSGIY